MVVLSNSRTNYMAMLCILRQQCFDNWLYGYIVKLKVKLNGYILEVKTIVFGKFLYGYFV